MAYTYDDFLNAANKSGMLGQFDDNDMQLSQQHPEYGLSMLSLKRDYGNAQTPEQRLLINEAANQLRGSYAPKYYADGTQQSITPAVAGVAQQERGFTYSLKDDPVWADYRKEYLREGERATANALGQANAASAGRTSTAAMTAATQAGDYYATQLTDKIPQLYTDAWQREMQQREQDQQQMGNAYNNLVAQITSAGYEPTEDEMAAAGMNEALVKQLLNAWIVSNPDAAWQQGKISATDYERLTGKPPIKTSGGGGGGNNNKNNFYEQYVALLNSGDVTTGTLNSWLLRQNQAGVIDDATLAALTIHGTNRPADNHTDITGHTAADRANSIPWA